MITDKKRAFKRVPLKFKVRFEFCGEKGVPGGASISENISMGGVYFLSIKKMEIGQLIECRIQMPGSAGEGCWDARIVRCDLLEGQMVETFGVAAEFVKSHGDSERRLKKVLSR
ncbi:MAG: PilZ domain-containing protein [Candidatus Tantalella remota]|nr:PilZ domain-containing protein [Candidatus Tantalella remota]